MTLLVYGENAGRTHENQMLQAFLERIEERWATSTDWIFVIANAMWSGAEIDLVCILPSSIIVADFKGYGGKLTGTENGPWQADGVIVKGGRKANPYQQLRDNKFSVLEWLQSKALLPGRNLGHISAGVVFSKHIDSQLDLSPKVRSWFYTTHLGGCATLLDGLASPELRIDRKEAQEIVHRLGVPSISWNSTRPVVRPIEARPAQPEGRTPLTGHQREALQALLSFASSNELVTFSVLGMTSTGKSRLMAEVAIEIEKSGKKPIVLTPNRRLAEHAPLNAESIYAHIYSGGTLEEEQGSLAEEKLRIDVVPLRRCADAEDCIYLLDDAHLLGNSKFTTPDGKQYGTGHLLDDLLGFTALGESKRKAIFFGDPYQIQRSSDHESALNGEFQKSRNLKHQRLELMQVIDTTGGSAKLANAERLVAAIRSERFAMLDLLQDAGCRRAEKKDAAMEVLDHYRSNPFTVWYLAETHAKVNSLTQWIRERLHGKKLLESLEERDLLEIYVSPESKDYAVASGSRRMIASIGTRDTHSQPLRGRTAPISFHSVQCVLDGGEQTTLDILEEFLSSEKPELDADTAIAEKVLRTSKKKAGQAPLPLTYARYGYASTVHHAQGMSQPICYVNCDHAAGRHSEGFFRWLYSALTIAERELVLLNFTEIHQFDAAVWNASAVKVSTDLTVGTGWSFQPDGAASERDQHRELPPGLDQSKDLLKSVSIWLRIANAAEQTGWRGVNAACHAYQEQYDLLGPEGEECQLRIAYNGKNVVTAMHAKDPAHWQLLSSLASRCVELNSYSMDAVGLLGSIRLRLGRSGFKLVSAIETPYRLLTTVVRENSEHVSLEVNFDKQGLVSGVRPLLCSNIGLPEVIRDALL